jgi:membrane protease YdiL (CAAX protease family)
MFTPLRVPEGKHVAISVALAFAFWAAVFACKLVNFWLGLGAAALVLTLLSFYWGGVPLARTEATVANVLRALASAAALYALFALGRYASLHVFPFASGQICDIYAIRQEAAPGFIALVLLFVTSPCEELFWRGFVQRFGMARFGAVKGWLFASLMYAGIHISSGNFMLAGAALTAGLFWGGVYMRTQSVSVCILSHAVWTVSIFLVLPMQ